MFKLFFLEGDPFTNGCPCFWLADAIKPFHCNPLYVLERNLTLNDIISSLCTHYVVWISCLISFVWAQSSCAERKENENKMMKKFCSLPTLGFEPTTSRSGVERATNCATWNRFVSLLTIHCTVTAGVALFERPLLLTAILYHAANELFKRGTTLLWNIDKANKIVNQIGYSEKYCEFQCTGLFYIRQTRQSRHLM